jgi:hypothetical protein
MRSDEHAPPGRSYRRPTLPAAIAEHKVPGAAIAVYAGGGVIDDATGVLSKSSGVEATADSVFQVARADPDPVPGRRAGRIRPPVPGRLSFCR